MVNATDIVTVLLLVNLCGDVSDSWSTCSEDHKCTNSQTCCGNFCVDGPKVCKIECQKKADCDHLGDAECSVDGFCECIEAPSCSNTSILYDGFQWIPCREDLDCEDAKCRNRTCVVSKDMPEKLPLNPALLAIVTIIGVLMFSCLFCCCLSRMKSERNSMKTRLAKGKLKLKARVESSDSDSAGKTTSLPLINAASHVVSSAPAEKNAMALGKDEEALISVVINGPGLPPIREEDEDDDTDKD